MDTEKLDIKKGIVRLASVYSWPNDPVIAGKDKDDFDALCEFVLFKKFVMNPFFKSLLNYLFKHIAELYKYLYSLPMDKTCMLTYKEAFLFMRVLDVDKVKLILEQTSYSSYVYNGIIRSLEEDSYDLFLSALDKSDYTKTMQVLWVMRYILLGEKGDWNAIDPSTPYQTLLPYLPRWINIVDDYKPYFEVREGDDDGKLLDERVIEIVRGRLRKKRKAKRNPSPNNNYNENFVEDNKKELEGLFEGSLFKTQWKDLLAEFFDNCDLPDKKYRVNALYIENLAKLILTHNVILHKDCIMEKYGIDSSEVYYQFKNTDVFTYEDGDRKDFGRYILYYTWEMLYIYNKVEAVLSNETKEVLNNLLSLLFYSKLLKTKIASNGNATDVSTPKEPLKDCSSFDEGTQFLGSKVINDWKKEVDKHKKVKTFTILKLNDEDIEKLTKGLVDKGFIEKNTNPERLAHILSGEDYDGGAPIIWIKKEHKNSFPSKRTALNFLRLMGGIEWKDKTLLQRLNCCFICSSEYKYVPFRHNNLKEDGKYNASSEYNGELKSIIETALGKGHAISVRMDNISLIE